MGRAPSRSRGGLESITCEPRGEVLRDDQNMGCEGDQRGQQSKVFPIYQKSCIFCFNLVKCRSREFLISKVPTTAKLRNKHPHTTTHTLFSLFENAQSDCRTWFGVISLFKGFPVCLSWMNITVCMQHVGVIRNVYSTIKS